MMLQSRSLRSKVARRIFVVFLVCAVIPFTGLFLTLYYQVSTFLEDRNQEQLRALAKIIGMELFEKLTLLESGLKIIGTQTLVSEGVPNTAVIENLPANPRDRWKSIVLVSSNGLQYPLLGQIGRTPEFSPSDQRTLQSGKSLMKIISTAGGRSRIFISLMTRPKETGPDILIGEVENSYLWDFVKSRLLPNYVHLCITDQSGITLMCESQAATNLLVHTRSTSERGTVSDIEWNSQAQKKIASQWSLPLKFQFQTPGWDIALETSNEGAFVSIAEIKKPFFLGIVVSLGLSILLAIFSIRKRLVPVEQLQEGTRRIAENDFSFRVNIQSNDEFEELANSVNAMASQLGRQFHTLMTKADIDRAVLSLLNTDAIVQTVLSRLMNIFPCDAASVLLVGAATETTDHFYIAKASDANGSKSRTRTSQLSQLKPSVTRPNGHSGFSDSISCVEIRKGDNPLLSHLAKAEIPLVLNENGVELVDPELVGLRGIRSMMAAPLLVKEDILAVLAFYAEKPSQFRSRDLEFFQSLTNQLAIAIYNAQLFETVKHQAAELEKSNKAKDEFLGIVSHELRTPMNVILGYLSLLHEGMLGELNEEQNKALDTVAKHSKDLLEMIESIMGATKIESGAVMIETQEVDVVSIFDELKSQYDILPRGKGVTLFWVHAPNLPVLQTDRSKLMQILQNLIGNAIKFTEEGYVTVSAAYLPEQTLLEFRVEDTGIGIPEESQAQIFEIFCQVDSSKTRKYGGIGLGLYIVKKLATLIGANVSVKSESGHGSSFTITVPLDPLNLVSASTMGQVSTSIKTAQ